MIQVEPIPCLKDNYAYLVFDPQSTNNSCAIVDPSQSKPVLNAIQEKGLTLSMIWMTHHHWDHVGGVEKLAQKFPKVKVIASLYDSAQKRIPMQNLTVQDSETFSFLGREVTSFEVPGHTLGALAYKIENHLFTGDTLFLGGCGRVFEGTIEMMAQSLKKLRSMPPQTKIWCGHEYTLKNLAFAQTVEPQNPSILKTVEQAQSKIQTTGFSVPGTIEIENEVNPFFRFDLPTLQKDQTKVGSFTQLRKQKDQF